MRDYSRVTLMFCLPRSRSQWFCWFIGKSPNMVCWHDPLKNCAHPVALARTVDQWLDDVANKDKRLFIADTAASMFRTRLLENMPGMNYFYVVRDPAEVAESMRRQIGFEMQDFIHRQHKHLMAAVDAELRFVALDYADMTLGELAWVWQMATDHANITVEALLQYRSTHIGKPVRQQEANPQMTRSLLGYAEFVQ